MRGETSWTVTEMMGVSDTGRGWSLTQEDDPPWEAPVPSPHSPKSMWLRNDQNRQNLSWPADYLAENEKQNELAQKLQSSLNPFQLRSKRASGR